MTASNDIEVTMEKLKIQVRDLQMTNERLAHELEQEKQTSKTQRELTGQSHDAKVAVERLNTELRAKLVKQDEFIAHLQKRCKDESDANDRIHDNLKELAKTCDGLRAELRDYNPSFIEMEKAAYETLKVLGIDSPFTQTKKETILEAFKRIQAWQCQTEHRTISGVMIDTARSIVTRFDLPIQYDISRPVREFILHTLTALDEKLRKNIEDRKFADLKFVKDMASTNTQLLGKALVTETNHPRDNLRLLFGQLHDAIRASFKTIENKDARLDARVRTIEEVVAERDRLREELEFEREGWGKLGIAFFNDETKTMEDCLIEANRIAAQGRKQAEFTINMDVFTDSCRTHAGDGLNDLGWPTVKTAGTLLTSIKASCEALRAYRSTLIKIQCAVKGSTKLKTLDYHCKVGDLDQLVEAVNDCISIEASNTRVVVRDAIAMIEKIENTGMDARRRLQALIPKG